MRTAGRVVDRLPCKLALREGAKWSGTMTVLSSRGSRYVVAFDAEDPSADPQERYVYDRTAMSAEQIREWTGVEIER